MKKLLVTSIAFACLSTSVSYAASTVSLTMPANPVVAPRSEVALSLNALQTDVPYRVTCKVNSSAPAAIDMILTPRLAAKGGFGVAQVNDKPMTNRVGTLQTGENTVSFMASIAAAKQTNDILLKNLDDRFSSTLSSCEATPVNNVTDAAHKVMGGYFYVTNNLPYYVDITVGSYSPTGYCLYPNSVTYITASTSYQDQAIVGTHY